MFNNLNIVVLALTTFYMTTTPASAHGYVSIPPSRQSLCASRQVPGCGNVMYEPQSVEARQGSFLCNGGGHRFHELNNHNLMWPTNDVQGTNAMNVRWTITADHRTASWQYYMLTIPDNGTGALISSVDGGNNTIGSNVIEHSVSLEGYSGKQRMLAVWNIGDTPNAFYSCIDIFIKSSDTDVAPNIAVAAQIPIGLGEPIGAFELGPAVMNSGSGSGTASPDLSLSKGRQHAYIVLGAS